MKVKAYILKVCQQAHEATYNVARASTKVKNQALLSIADTLISRENTLLAANKLDLQAAGANGLSTSLIDRLELNSTRITAMAQGLRQVAKLPDPVGCMTEMQQRPSGIRVGRMRTPLGVVGIIYESRPSVTADAAALGIKSGNAVILRGGSEAIHSIRAIADCIYQGLASSELPDDTVQIIATPERAAVGELLKMSAYVDLIIPRGGKDLIKRINAEACMPVLKHLDGICHVYIDSQADIGKAVNVAYNAKTHRYGVCNAMECLLVAEPIARSALEKLGPMYEKQGVEIRGCRKSCMILPGIKQATETDYHTEYLAPIMSLRIVDGLDAAIKHINQYGSQHTDAIVTEDKASADRFLREVDSSSVMVNASTRFADGFEYGLGAEIGISTDKIHARGPVGLEGLTSQKYIVIGDGHVRA